MLSHSVILLTILQSWHIHALPRPAAPRPILALEILAHGETSYVTAASVNTVTLAAGPFASSNFFASSAVSVATEAATSVISSSSISTISSSSLQQDVSSTILGPSSSLSSIAAAVQSSSVSAPSSSSVLTLTTPSSVIASTVTSSEAQQLASSSSVLRSTASPTTSTQAVSVAAVPDEDQTTTTAISYAVTPVGFPSIRPTYRVTAVGPPASIAESSLAASSSSIPFNVNSVGSSSVSASSVYTTSKSSSSSLASSSASPSSAATTTSASASSSTSQTSLLKPSKTTREPQQSSSFVANPSSNEPDHNSVPHSSLDRSTASPSSPSTLASAAPQPSLPLPSEAHASSPPAETPSSTMLPRVTPVPAASSTKPEMTHPTVWSQTEPEIEYITSVYTLTITVDHTKIITSCSTSTWAKQTGESTPAPPALTLSSQDSPPPGVPSSTAPASIAPSCAASPSAATDSIVPSSAAPPPALAPAPVTIVQTEAGPGFYEKTTLTVTLRTTLITSAIQTVTVTASPMPGTVHTSLQSAGNPSVQPFNTTVIPTPASQITPIQSGSGFIMTSTTVTPTNTLTGNIFVPIASGAPPSQIMNRNDHPVPRIGINQRAPIETNKFYANFFLGTRNASTWTHPYSMAWAAGEGVTTSWGLAIEHVTRSQTVYGPGTPPSYYINPLGLQSIVVSATQLGAGTSLTTNNVKDFSARVDLSPPASTVPMIQFPLVQGMGFVTAIYAQGTPLLQSSIFFTSMKYLGTVPGSNVVRYTVTLTDNNVWFIYLTPSSGSVPTLTLISNAQIRGNKPFSGTLQVAKLPPNMAIATAQSMYDKSAGVYSTDATLTGTATRESGTYSLSWSKSGLTSKTLLMFSLPHHVASFAATTKEALQSAFTLQTTTKGIATAVLADSWSMQEVLPVDIDLAPWSPAKGSQSKLPQSAVSLIRQVASMELNEDIEAQTDLDSMYYSGKALAKFATIVYTANNLANATGIASAGLIKLKTQFARFVDNRQIYPLVYDTQWGGVVSSATYATGDEGLDFGNTLYNDHHFHYGYFVYAAAVIARLDPSWLKQGSSKAWVQTLLRDYANPVSDAYFPQSRMFDWYHGHSWAHGLYETFDGKDQESSSEDAFASYAIKMWGKAIGDAKMEARGALMLAIQARSFSDYYYMQDSNTIQPPSFVPNKAAGIMFENKVDHTTYFGTDIEYIEGIHMLPLNPSSTLTRPLLFVQQEWDTYFSNGRVDAINSGWKGILYANYAIINPKAAYAFFAQSGFQPQWLDGGASRTWYLAFSAGLGGAQ